MDKSNSKTILILGCQRSGTTLLSALLGRHSEINMLFESITKDTFRGIGKKYNGNKLLTWRQIRMNQRSSRFGHLINRIVNLDIFKSKRHHQLRVYPTSKFSIQDYIEHGAIIITITRAKEEVVNSIISRTQMSTSKAEREYDRAMSEMEFVKPNSINVDFKELINNTEETLQRICKELNLDYESRMLSGTEYNFVYPHKEIIKNKK